MSEVVCTVCKEVLSAGAWFEEMNPEVFLATVPQDGIDYDPNEVAIRCAPCAGKGGQCGQ